MKGERKEDMKKIKRGYIEKVGSTYDVSISKVTISEDEFHIVSEDEDWYKSFGGFESIQEATEFLMDKFKCKEIIVD